MSRPLDHLKHVPFQAPAVTPLSREQGRYSSKEQEQTEVGELQEQENPRETAHTNNPSKEQEQTEEGKMQELEEHDKEQGPDSPEEQDGPVKQNPGETAHTETRNNREFHMDGEKHGRNQATNPSKEQEQTEEDKMQELEEHDKDQGPDSPEEQAGPVKHPMRKKAG